MKSRTAVICHPDRSEAKRAKWRDLAFACLPSQPIVSTSKSSDIVASRGAAKFVSPGRKSWVSGKNTKMSPGGTTLATDHITGRPVCHSISATGGSPPTAAPSPPNTTKPTTPHSLQSMSPTENKPSCSSPDKLYPPATAPAAHGRGPEKTPPPQPPPISRQKRSASFLNQPFPKSIHFVRKST